MKAQLDQTLFLSSYILCLIDAFLFGYSTFSDIPYANIVSLILKMAAIGIVVAKIILDRHYHISTLVCMIFVGSVFLIAYLNSGYAHLLYLIIVCIGVRNVDKEVVINIDFWLRLCLVFFIIFCGLTGIIEKYITYRTESTVLRYSMGFNHPNTLACVTLSLVLEDFWLRKRKPSGVHTLIVWILAIIIYFITANRTAVLIMALFPIVLYIIFAINNRFSIRHDNGVVFSLLFPIAIITSIIMMLYCEDNFLLTNIDSFLSKRFYNAAQVYDSYGISLLGQQVELISVKAARLNNSSIALLDVAYLRTLIQAGPLVLLIFAGIYSNVMRKAWINGDKTLVLITLIYIVFGFCESAFNNVFMNFTLMLAASAFYSMDKNEQGSDNLCVKT